ncbi:MAG: hypothetical protein ACK5Y2_03930 [Bdellovibrionales bacterium]
MLKSFLFSISIATAAIPSLSRAVEFSCFEKDEVNQIQMEVTLDSREPRLSMVYSYEDRSGRQIVSQKDLISAQQVCEESLNFKALCRLEEKNFGAHYSFEYSCRNGNKGHLFFDEAGGLELQCNDSRKLTKMLSATGCKRIR